ncbi:hypothetical protein CWC28_02635 [Pseudoalteromonas sp. S4492]|uniref:coiled-coil domain-containing protein n=1 Tax=Pseudoalteromonas sp. S4492 TaxID=579560 RepID=UPI00110AED65|nr:hypothetical protein [Pseudoalteromonas sp. S4492]TMO30742.1 hypothetical protein CWC28_02635 [Pseudoalteromonas sp. S4492]
MNETLPLNKAAKKEVVFNSIDEVIVDVFKEGGAGKTKKPLKLLSAHKKYLNNIVFKDRVSADILKKYPGIILARDSDLKLTTEIVTNVYNATNNEAKNSCINFFCDVIGEISFLNPTKHDSNVFRAILSSLGDNENALPYLINELNKRFDKRLEGIKKSKSKAEAAKINESEIDSAPKGMTAAQLKSLRYNVLAIAALWSVSLGKTTQTKAIDTLSNIFTAEIDEKSPSLSIESFLAGHINSSSKKELGALIARSLKTQQDAQDDKRKAQEQSQYYKKQLDKALADTQSLNLKLSDSNKKIEELQSQLQKLQETIESKEQLGKAERVHLKDDTGKVKSKAINLLEEEVIPPLRTSLKALDRDEPKVKVAIHNIDVIIEEVEGALQWFKK